MRPNASSDIPTGSRELAAEEKAALLRDMATVIETSHLFKSLDEAGRNELLAAGYVVGWLANETVLREGEPGDSMYVILNGNIRVETRAPGGSLVLANLSRGACIGEVALLTDQPRTATVTAITDTSAVCFTRARVAHFLHDYPHVREILEALIEGRARATIDKLIGT